MDAGYKMLREICNSEQDGINNRSRHAMRMTSVESIERELT